MFERSNGFCFFERFFWRVWVVSSSGEKDIIMYDSSYRSSKHKVFQLSDFHLSRSKLSKLAFFYLILPNLCRDYCSIKIENFGKKKMPCELWNEHQVYLLHVAVELVLEQEEDYFEFPGLHLDIRSRAVGVDPHESFYRKGSMPACSKYRTNFHWIIVILAANHFFSF